jgi:hypothetical protein
LAKGTLEKSLVAMNADKVEALRLKAISTFEKAVEEGKLPGSSKLPKDKEVEIDALRMRVRDLFIQGCDDGELKQAFTDMASVKDSRVNVESTKFPGAKQQTQMSWSHAPSVGTWMKKRHKVPVAGVTREGWWAQPSVGTWLSPLAQVPLDVVKLNEAISRLSADELAAELRTWPQEAVDRVKKLLKVPLDVVKLNAAINRLSAEDLVAQLRTWPQEAVDRVKKLLKVPLDAVTLNEAISRLSADELAAELRTWPQEAVGRVMRLLKGSVDVEDLRSQACEALINACRSGSLRGILETC